MFPLTTLRLESSSKDWLGTKRSSSGFNSTILEMSTISILTKKQIPRWRIMRNRRGRSLESWEAAVELKAP